MSCNESQSGLASVVFDKALEEFNNLRDKDRVANQCVRYIHEAFRFDILNSYLRGELSLFFYVQAALEVDGIRPPLEVPVSDGGFNSSAFILHLHSADAPGCKNWNEKSMFVPLVKIVNLPDRVIPSVARLYLIEHKTEERWMESVYIGLSKRAFYFFDVLMHGEFCPVIDERGSKSSNGLQPSVVKCALKVVDGVSDHESEIVDSLSIAKRVYKSLSSMLWVNLNRTGVSFVKRDDACFDILDVIVGPFNFESGICELHSERVARVG
jgi:hypothetical protein